MEMVRTRFGDVPIKLRGEGRPDALLVIRGSFPAADALEWLAPEGADTAFLHLPGFFSPTLDVTSLGVFIAAFDDVIRARFAGARLTVLGLSTGAVVAAGLRAPEVRARVLVEPFFQTGPLWALQEQTRHLIRRTPATEAWCWSILGVDRTRAENRDYRPALRPGVPTLVLTGSEPLLPRRPMWKLPSLTTAEDHEFLACAGARFRAAPGGHDVPSAAPELVTAAAEEGLQIARRP